MKDKQRKSETYPVVGLLAVVGGFLNAYTFIVRGGVFATAQTGNVVLLGVEVINGNWRHVGYYLVPIIAFILGIVVAELIREVYPKKANIKWRQVVIAIEIIVLLIVAFLPANKWDTIANIQIAFISSLQIQAFRRVNGNLLMTTMCTGNLRSATEQLIRYSRTKDEGLLSNSLQYCGVVLLFMAGAAGGTLFSKMWGIHTTLVGCVLLSVVFVMMFGENRE